MNNKGSALIMVLVVTSMLMILGSSLVNITFAERNMSRMYKNSVSAQYISEAGIGRAVSIIKKNIKDRIESVFEEAKIKGVELYGEDPRPTEEEMKQELDSFIFNRVSDEIADYLANKGPGADCFSEDIKMYQGKEPMGEDSLMFTDENGVESYYTVKASLHGSPQERMIKVESTGCLGDAKKTITAYYKVQDVEIVDVKFPKSDLDLYLQNAITAIGPTSETYIPNQTTVDGNVLLVSESVSINTQFIKNWGVTGNLAVKANNVDFNNVNVPGNLILDTGKAPSKMKVDVKGNKYSSYYPYSDFWPLYSYPMDDTNDWGASLLVETGEEVHIRDFQLGIIDEIKLPDTITPEQMDEFNFIYVDENNPFSKDRVSDSKYNVIIAKGNLAIDKKDFKDGVYNGLIYCAGVLQIKNHVTVNGMIIAFNVDCTNGGNHFVVNYKKPVNLDALSDIINHSAGDELKINIVLDSYKLSCKRWIE